MKFSIICPVFNNLLYLQECVQSILSQSYTEWELLLIDDGSTDGTSKLCDSFDDPRILVFHKKNEGQYKSRMFGVKKASGNYICFVDSDDYLYKDALKNLSLHITEKEVDIISYNYHSFRTSSDISMRKDSLIDKKLIISGNGNIINIYFFKYFLFSLWSTCFKKELFTENIFSLDDNVGIIGEDTLLVYRVLTNAGRAVLITNTLYFYRMNQDSISHKKGFNLCLDRINNLNSIYSDIFNKYGLIDNDNINLSNKISWPIINSIISCALENKFSSYKHHMNVIKKMFIFKHYFKAKSLVGKYSKMIAFFAKSHLLLILYFLIKIVESHKHIYEKGNY